MTAAKLQKMHPVFFSADGMECAKGSAIISR